MNNKKAKCYLLKYVYKFRKIYLNKTKITHIEVHNIFR